MLFFLGLCYDAYMRFGGMPGIADIGLNQERAPALLEGIYSTVVVRDILEREKRRGQRQITDSGLLRKIWDLEIICLDSVIGTAAMELRMLFTLNCYEEAMMWQSGKSKTLKWILLQQLQMIKYIFR